MKNLLILPVRFFVLFAFMPLVSQAADVEVKWSNPDKYRDIYAGEENRKHFKENTFKALEEHLLKLSEALPKSQTLKIDVTDVDLAGSVHHGGSRQIRVIKDIYFPRIKLSFQLLNANQSVVLSGEENLKDMNFLMGTRLRYRNKTLGYERQLLDDWFDETFENFVKK
jgi:hypothetical protein